MNPLRKSALVVAAGLAVAFALPGTSLAQQGIDPLSAPDWLPPLRPPTDGEIAPPLPEVVPGMIILPEKRVDPDAEQDDTFDDPSAPAPEIPPWHTNPRSAHKLAKENGKYHIMALMGFEWKTNPNASVLLRDEVLNTPSFSKFTKDKYILSYIDYPGSAGDWSKRHKQVKSFYDVKGFPTLIVFDDEGRQVGRIAGYKATSGRVEREFLFRAELKQVLKTDAEAKQREARAHEKRIEEGYREWESAQGSTLFAKLIRANAKYAVFENEERQIRKVLMSQLSLGDRELVKRMVRARDVPTRITKR